VAALSKRGHIRARRRYREWNTARDDEKTIIVAAQNFADLLCA